MGKTIPQESIRGKIRLLSDSAELRALRANHSLLQCIAVGSIRAEWKRTPPVHAGGWEEGRAFHLSAE
jgi:hypothetical protein